MKIDPYRFDAPTRIRNAQRPAPAGSEEKDDNDDDHVETPRGAGGDTSGEVEPVRKPAAGRRPERSDQDLPRYKR